jgi:hypothetical protein
VVVGEVANSTETCPVKHRGEADKIPLVFVQPHTTDKTPNKITLTCHGLVMPSLQSNKIHHLFSLCLTGMVRISQKIMNCQEAAALLPHPTVVDSQISVKVKENGWRVPLNFV